jgi:hypothetical protein
MVCQYGIHGAANGYMSVSRGKGSGNGTSGRGHWRIGA